MSTTITHTRPRFLLVGSREFWYDRHNKRTEVRLSREPSCGLGRPISIHTMGSRTRGKGPEQAERNSGCRSILMRR